LGGKKKDAYICRIMGKMGERTEATGFKWSRKGEWGK